LALISFCINLAIDISDDNLAIAHTCYNRYLFYFFPSIAF
jgi:hypothetical protein